MQTQTWLGRLLLKLHLFFSGSVLCIYRNPKVIPRNYLSMERALEKESGEEVKKLTVFERKENVYILFNTA